MNLIYLRTTAPRAKKFIKGKLKGAEPRSIYDIEAGDCCLAPAAARRGDYLVTFLNDVSPEMLGFIYRTGGADTRRN
ncbi:MAG: hypothetical protein ACYC2I_07345 [Elusimicrobiales bacterium]